MIWERVSEVIKEAIRPAAEPRSPGLLGADMHAHLIPGIDDGAPDSREALDMLRAIQDAGYQRCYATPHVMQDYYPNSREVILKGVEKLGQQAREEGLHISIEAAAEYYLDDTFREMIGTAELLPLNNRFLLFELSFTSFPKSLPDVLFRIQAEGLKPVLAHPERYPYMFRQKSVDQLTGLRERGCLYQVNIGSLVGSYGPEVRRAARMLVDAGMVDFLGSDLHRRSQAEIFELLSRDRWFHKLLDSRKLLNSTLLP